MTDLPIPLEALDDAGIVLGRRGAGKSNTLMCLFERELDAGHRTVMVDPKGDRWGIRLNPDRTASRFDIPIFGGSHADLPLTDDMGDRMGRLIADHNLSCLIDLSLMSLAGKQRFMMGFAEQLLEHNRAALTLFIEEVDQFANQDPRYQPAMLVHHIANFATLGRQRGIVPWVASQRPAKVNATVRSQSDTFIGMKVTVALDRKAYREWFEGHSKEAAARVDTEVGRLQPGEALVWVGATDFFEKVQFPRASTYDSGRTPRHGETVEGVTLPPIDMGALTAALAAAGEDAPAKAKVAYDAGAAAGALLVEKDAEITRLRDKIIQLERREALWSGRMDLSLGIVNAIATDVAKLRLRIMETIEVPARGGGCPEVDEGQTSGVVTAVSTPRRVQPVHQRQEPPSGPVPAFICVADAGAGSVSKSVAKLLDAVAWWNSFGLSEPSANQVGFIAGYAPTGGTFQKYRGEAKTKGMLVYPSPGRLSLTEAGRSVASQPAAIPSLTALHDAIRENIDRPLVKLLDPVLEAYPEAISANDVGAAAGYEVTGGTFQKYRGQLKTLEIVEYPAPGYLRAADWLFPEIER